MSDTTPTIRFYADTHMAKAVSVQLRQRGVDIVRCEEVGMANASDEQHLEYATREGRVMVSQDDDFRILDGLWKRREKSHAGIMLVPSRHQGEAQISSTFKALLEYHEYILVGAAILEVDVIDRVIQLRDRRMNISLEHILIDKDGYPRTQNRGVKVRILAAKFIEGGASAEELAEHYGITVADVHAALTYYYDHKAAFDEHDRYIQELAKNYPSAEEHLAQIRARLNIPDE